MQISNKQWSEVKKRVRKRSNMSVVDYERLLQPLQSKTFVLKLVVIAIPNEETMDSILSCYKEYLTMAIQKMLEIQCEVSFELNEGGKTGLIHRQSMAQGHLMK